MAGDGSRSSADFDAFYAATAPGMVRALVPLTGELAEAEDVAQEAYERAWLHWSTVCDCASPEAWVRTVARRLAVSRWRRMRNASTAWVRRMPAKVVPDLDPAYRALIEALRELPPKQRVAIVLHHLVDLPVEQVAAETGSSVSAVKKQLTRGRSGIVGAAWRRRSGPRRAGEPDPAKGRAMTDSVSDLLHAGSDRLQPTLPPAQSVRSMAERRRHNRRIAAMVHTSGARGPDPGAGRGGAAAHLGAPAIAAPPGPDPVSGLLTLDGRPVHGVWRASVRPGASPAALSACVSSPLTWGAVESRGATYGRPGEDRVYNEFVLRYDSVAAAHRAVLDAWRQFRRCPTPPNVATDPLESADTCRRPRGAVRKPACAFRHGGVPGPTGGHVRPAGCPPQEHCRGHRGPRGPR